MYECSICKKMFENIRKLNGHKSSHQSNRRGKSKKNEGKITSYDIRLLRKDKHDCKFCGLEFETGQKLGGHAVYCKSRPDISTIQEKTREKNRKINARPDVRDKISRSNQEFLERNPHMIPYVRNNSSKKSFPEEIFESLLIENKIEGWFYNYRVGRYIFDFAFPDLKLDVEIDGSLHLTDKGILHDKKRDEYSTSLGWKVLRISAADVKNKNLHYDILNRLSNHLKGL